MAYSNDDLDAGLLATIGLAGALLVVAGSYYASGIYWKYRGQTRAAVSVQPAIDRVHAKRDAELASLKNAPLSIELAMAAVAAQHAQKR